MHRDTGTKSLITCLAPYFSSSSSCLSSWLEPSTLGLPPVWTMASLLSEADGLDYNTLGSTFVSSNREGQL